MESDKGQVESGGQVPMDEHGLAPTDTDGTGPIVYWDVEDAERLSCKTLGEFLEDYVDGMDGEPVEGLTVRACGYARMVPCASMVDPLEHCLERVEEEYGDPDGCGLREAETRMGPDAEARLKAAEAAFVSAVIAEYVPWMCEVVTTQTVDLYAWWQAQGVGARPIVLEEV